MKITLDANPSDAPCCVKIEAEDGRSRLIQTDWDYPAVASVFGWDKNKVQKDYKRGRIQGDYSASESFDWFAECGVYGCRNCSLVFYPMELEAVNKCPDCDSKCKKLKPCEHDSTDGTVTCKCGLQAGDFIQSARQWMDDNDGATAEDPGYFD